MRNSWPTAVSSPGEPRAWDDFLTFSRAMLATRDEEPFFPVLAAVTRTWPPEAALWLTFLFVAYCHLGSAWRAWQLQPRPGSLPEVALAFPFYTDRRGLRGGRLAQHVASYLAHLRGGTQAAWLRAGWGRDPLMNYERFWAQAQRLWGNARWAAFKWAEALKKVHGWPLAAPDMRLAFCSGPKAGLCWLFEFPETTALARLNAAGTALLARLAAAGVTVDWETLETLLCNWHSLVRGRYYVGCDIDAQAQEITTIPDAAQQRPLWIARAQVLPRATLGEFSGRPPGVQASRLRLYRDMGQVVVYGETVFTADGRAGGRQDHPRAPRAPGPAADGAPRGAAALSALSGRD
jgi:hypothetical protein